MNGFQQASLVFFKRNHTQENHSFPIVSLYFQPRTSKAIVPLDFNKALCIFKALFPFFMMQRIYFYPDSLVFQALVLLRIKCEYILILHRDI
jgi:hypothetical protein